jgi:hypothetical protein
VTEPRTPEEAAAAARERARERVAAGDYGDARRLEELADERPALDRLGEWAVIDVGLENVRSTRRAGGPITTLKRFLVRLLRQYTAEEQAQVTRFNVHILGYVAALEDRVDQLERRVRELESAQRR